MKKIKLFLVIIMIGILIDFFDVVASTQVYIRTEGNYLVPNDVIITESIKGDVLSTPAINVEEKIYDFADLLIDKEEKKLYNKMKKFIDGSNLDYAIVTISKNSKESAKKYAHDFYNYNDFKYDGLLLLIDMDNGSIYMTTNGKAYELFPSSRMQPILKNVFSKIKNKQYYDACLSFTNSISDFADIEVKDDEVVRIDDDGSVEVKRTYYIFWLILFSLAITSIIVGIFILITKRKCNIRVMEEDFLNKETVSIKTISEEHLGIKQYKSSISSKSNQKDGDKIE